MSEISFAWQSVSGSVGDMIRDVVIFEQLLLYESITWRSRETQGFRACVSTTGAELLLSLVVAVLHCCTIILIAWALQLVCSLLLNSVATHTAILELRLDALLVRAPTRVTRLRARCSRSPCTLLYTTGIVRLLRPKMWHKCIYSSSSTAVYLVRWYMRKHQLILNFRKENVSICPII